MTMTDWVCKNTTLRNRPFSIKGYEFQKKILDDMHPDLSVIKISQTGLTEIQLRKALAFLVRNNGTSLIFTEPNEDMFTRVSNSRVKPLVAKDKVFNTPMDKENKATRSIGMMQFGQSFLYLVPALETAATSIPADVVFNDELDLSDQKIISLFNSRLQNSKYKISQKFSTPSFPSYGIDLNWQTSDQQLYLCKCDSCGHWNSPEFHRDFIHLPGLPELGNLDEITVDMQDKMDFNDAYIMCEKCGAALDLANSDNREWVPQFPSRVNSRGYRVSPFCGDKLSLLYIFKQLWEYQKNEYKRGFYNTVLGTPYSDGTIQIPFEDIMACMTDQPNHIDPSDFEDCWVGIDMGQTCHVVIGRGSHKDHLEVIAMYEVNVKDIVQHCKDLVKRLPIRCGAIDRHPYEPTAREIFQATGGKIVPVEYRGAKDMNIVYDEYKTISHIQVNNTWFLDQFASKVRKRLIKISGYGHKKMVYAQHLREMVRDEVPGEPATWKKLSGNDHYFHASAFMTIAIQIKELLRYSSEEEVRTMTMTKMVHQKEQVPNLIGISNKRLEKHPGIGYE